MDNSSQGVVVLLLWHTKPRNLTNEGIQQGGETKSMTARTRAARKRCSAKKKAQVLTVCTMIFLVVVILLLPHAFAYEDPTHCYGYSDCYSIGQSRGQTNAYNDYWSNS